MPDTAPPDTTDDALAAIVDPPPMLWTPPVCAFDWSGAVLSPAFFAALAAAQERVEAVGKSARNTDQDYNYAPADAVVAEIRRAFAPCGVGFLCSWRTFDRPWKVVSTKIYGDREVTTQWLDFHVVLDWVLTYGDTDANLACRLTGTADLVAIGSAGRPPDKSVLAARTELAGAVALGLGAIDRVNPPRDSGASDREGDDGAGPSAGRGRPVLNSAAKDRYTAAVRRLVAARKAAGHRIDGAPVTPLAVVAELMGPDFRCTTNADANRCADLADAAFERLRLEVSEAADAGGY